MKKLNKLNKAIALLLIILSTTATGYAQDVADGQFQIGDRIFDGSQDHNITGSPIVSGTVIYTASSKTLTLDNAIIEMPNADGILTKIDDLTINLVGDNSVTARYSAVALSYNSKISGVGTLTTVSTSERGIFVQKNSHVTIEGGTIKATGKHGISGFLGNSGEKLTIKAPAKVKATSSGTSGLQGSITNLANLILEGVVIIQPNEAAFNSSLRGVALNGELIRTEVEIRALGTGLEELHAVDIKAWGSKATLHITLPTPQNQTIQIYNLQGQHLRTIEPQNAINLQIPLPANTYIVRIGNASGKVIVR